MTTTNKPTNTSAALLIIGILFFVFGFVTWVNSVLIAFFKAAFALNNFESLLVTSAFFVAYFVEGPQGSPKLDVTTIEENGWPVAIVATLTVVLGSQQY